MRESPVRAAAGLAWAVTGASGLILARAGAAGAAAASGLGPWGGAPALGAAVAAFAAGAAAARLPGGGRRRAAAGALLAAAAGLAGILQERLVAATLPLWTALSPPPLRGGLAGFLVDALLPAAASCLPAAAAGLLLGGAPAGEIPRALALGAWGGAAALTAIPGSAPDPGALRTPAALALLALSAWAWLGRSGPIAETPGPSATRGGADARLRNLAVLLFLSGAFTAAALAVLGRLTSVVAGGTGPSRKAAALAGLFAAGLGASVAPRAIRRARDPWRLLGASLAAAGLLALLAAAAGDLLPFAHLDVLARAPEAAAARWAASFAVTAVTLLGPALFAGASLAVAASMAGAGTALGTAAAGAVLGLALAPSLVSGLGLQAAILGSGALAVGTGALVLVLEAGPAPGRALRAGALLGACAVLVLRAQPWDPAILGATAAASPELYVESGRARLAERTAHDRVLLADEGRLRRASVLLVEGRLPALVVDGAAVPLEGIEHLRAQALPVHVAALVAAGAGPWAAAREGRAARVLLLDAGAAAALAAPFAHGDAEVDVAARDGVVVRAALAAGRLLENAGLRPGAEAAAGDPAPAPRVLAADARRALRLAREGYDLIASPPLPSAEAAAALFSRGFLALARSRLRPGGAVALPIPLRRLPPAAVEAASAIFVEAFPGASAWWAGTELVLVGGAGPASPDLPALREALAGRGRLPESLAALDLYDPLKLLALRRRDPAGRPGGAGRADPEAALAEAARGPSRRRLAENLEALAASPGPAAGGADAFPASWSVTARAAVRQRLAVLGEAAGHVLLAAAALARGDAPAAAKAAETALRRDPSDAAARSLGARARTRLAESALARGEAARAAEELEAAVALDGASVDALTELGWLRYTEGRRGEAESLLRRAVARAPWVAILQYRLGLLRFEASDLEEARPLLERAYELDPRRPEPLLLLGDISRRRSDPERARELYARALQLGGRVAETRTAMAALSLDAGRLEEASADLEAALESKPGDPEALFTRARLLAARGDREGARRDLLGAVTTGGPPYRARALAVAPLRDLLIERDGAKGAP